MQSFAEMVKPGGTGKPRFAISASPAPLPPRMSRMAAVPSARPLPKEYTHRSSAGTVWGGGGGSDREWMQGRGVPRSRQIVFRNLGGIIAREAGVAELGGVAIRGAQHPVERQIAQRVYAEVLTDLLYVVARGNQLFFARRIDPVMTGSRDRRRRDPEMHLFRTRLTDELDERPTGGAPDDGVVHDDDLLSLQYFPDGIELDLDLGHPAGLGGVNERPPHIMVPDQRMLELGARPLGEAERHRVRRVGHGEDTVGAGRRMLGGELAPQRAPYPVHG